MNLSEKIKRHVDKAATESLEMMDQVAQIAAKQSADEELNVSSLATVNTLNTSKAIQAFEDINLAKRVSGRILELEPSIARIVVKTETGDERVYYICRATPIRGAPGLLASYKAPIGRLASLSIGDDFSLPNGEKIEVIERTRLHPSKLMDGWDSQDSIFERENCDPFTITSLRFQLRDVADPEEIEDLLSQVLAENAKDLQIYEGIRRDRITKMSLRDQPILDKRQDEIFRLPLDQRLLILGPPGTGKTTTLIRRLGQKIDVMTPDSLSDGERRNIDISSQSSGVPHAESWLMFTPTELLKQYLKDAFAEEGVPASGQRLKTWIDHRRELGRNVLGILRLPGSRSGFILKDQANIIAADAFDRSVDWFNDFNTWQKQFYVQSLQQGVLSLANSELPHAASVGKRITAILDRADTSAMPSLFIALQTVANELHALVGELKASTDKKIDDVLNLAMNHNNQFLEELGQFIDQLHVVVETDDDDVDAESEDDADTIPRTVSGPAISAFRSALKAQARAKANKRRMTKTSRSAQIAEWLGDRTLKTKDQTNVGAQLLLLSAARRFVNPVKRYVDNVPTRYRSYRKAQQGASKWYRTEPFSAMDLHPMELDIVILASLRSADELLRNPTIARRTQDSYWAALQTMHGLYKNQILVDEATDFSPIQLACMGVLANPQMRSFFACGDFNQRLTTWGSRSIDDLRWFFPDIDVRNINISYRQSRQLNELAHAIIKVLGGDTQDASLPPHINSDGESPALCEKVGLDDAVPWLAAQIRYIASYLELLPSTAIFVNNEAEVQLLADTLDKALEDDNIRVVACPKGQVMGNNNDVRVFDIQHIKGLEFEAVFFLSIDQLARQSPELFDKYLYVGTTRASTYLGITCTESLPESMEPLRNHFISNWATD